MQRQRDGLVPIGEVIGDLGGPVKELIRSRSTQQHVTLADQVDQLVTASETTPDLRFHGADDGTLLVASHQPRQPDPACPAQRPIHAGHERGRT